MSLCDFPMIVRFGFCSLCYNGIRFRLVSFHFGWRVLSCFLWREEVLWLCVGEVDAHRAKRPHAKEVLFDAHMQKRSYLMHSPCCPWGERQNVESMGEAATHRAKRLHTREDNIMPVVNGWIPWPVYVEVWYICDKLSYVIV